MSIEILCTPRFSKEESKEIGRIANSLGISRSELVRRAVKSYAAKCVPTHETAKTQR